MYDNEYDGECDANSSYYIQVLYFVRFSYKFYYSHPHLQVGVVDLPPCWIVLIFYSCNT